MVELLARAAFRLVSDAVNQHQRNKRYEESKVRDRQNRVIAQRNVEANAKIRQAAYDSLLKKRIETIRSENPQAREYPIEIVGKLARERLFNDLHNSFASCNRGLSEAVSKLRSVEGRKSVNEEVRKAWTGAHSEYAKKYVELSRLSGGIGDIQKLELYSLSTKLRLQDDQCLLSSKVAELYLITGKDDLGFMGEIEGVGEVEELRDKIGEWALYKLVLEQWCEANKIFISTAEDGSLYVYDVKNLQSEIEALGGSLRIENLDFCETEKTNSPESGVFLNSVGTDKMGAIRIIRSYTGMGLKDCVEFVDSLPSFLKNIKDAEGMVRDLKSIGAIARVM